jgi:hypothetical protein
MKFLPILLVIVLIGFGCSKWQNRAVDFSMKEVSYRGGLVTFSVPSNWKEEYGDDGGGMFYEDALNSGTLRLNVLTFADSDPSNVFDVNADARKTAAKYGGEAFVLRDGNAMARYDSEGVESGEAITQRFWQVYNRVNDSHIRIAVFSYTLPSARFGDERHAREMEMLDREIRNARFANTMGALQ